MPYDSFWKLITRARLAATLQCSSYLSIALWFARDRATAFMHSAVLSALSVLLDDRLLLLPSLTVVLRLISLDMAGMM